MEVLERYWVAHPEFVWIPCWFHNVREEDVATLVADDGTTVQLPPSELQTLAKASEREVCGVEDICTLDSVTEGTLLHNIRVRFSKKLIYTNIAGILIAVNPFESLPLYSSEMLEDYMRCGKLHANLAPHIFRVAADAAIRLS